MLEIHAGIPYSQSQKFIYVQNIHGLIIHGLKQVKKKNSGPQNYADNYLV